MNDLPQARYDYANPLFCLASGDGNGALMTEYALCAARAAGCNFHFIASEIGSGAVRRGFENGVTAKDSDALLLERLMLQGPCRLRAGAALRPPPEGEVCRYIRFPVADVLPSGLPFSPYLAGCACISESFALFCLEYPQHIRFHGEECADPSGMMLAAAMAAEYTGLIDAGRRLQGAVLAVIADGGLPYGLYRPGPETRFLDGAAFTKEVCERLKSADPADNPAPIDVNALYRADKTVSVRRAAHMRAHPSQCEYKGF